MNLKTALKTDLPIFVDLDEFGEVITIDGLILPAQVIHHTAERSARLTEHYAGLMGSFMTVYFMAEPYYKKRKKLPRFGEWVLINGKRYDVLNSREEHGLIKLECSAYRQNTLAPRPPY